MGVLRRLLSRAPRSTPRPDRPMAVVGDLHGRADLLEQMVEMIVAEAGSGLSLVFVGDHVDRGEDSATVLGLLQTLQNDIWPGEMICLRGNHEAMMLAFLDAPERAGPFWIQHGGASTLASFGIALPDGTPESLYRTRDTLCAAMPPATLAWLRDLPFSHLSGNVFVAHAGADPNAPLDHQTEESLLWGHPDFLSVGRRDGMWVAHGHYILEEPVAEAGRIAVDTGAYATHRLTAALIDEGVCRFLTTCKDMPGAA